MTHAFAGVFVTGTDTGVGKTRVACALLRELVARGLRPAGMKPIETGVDARGPLDALALRAASRSDTPLAQVCPQRFALPAAPAVAAAAEGRRVELEAILTAFDALRSRHDCVIAEGAGGLLVPLAPELSTAELARRLALPLLVVSRPRLGTLNHTLLTLEVARARGLALAGVVVSRSEPGLSAPEEENLAWLRRTLGPLWLGELPWLPEGAEPPPGWLALDALFASGPPVQHRPAEG